MNSTAWTSRGILNPKAGDTKFELFRFAPSPELEFFVSRYWVVRWDLRGREPYVQETLPYPCVNLVFEKDNTRLWGIDTGRFVRRLEGSGQVFGIKFRPGAFYPFVKTPVSRFTDTSVPFNEVFHYSPALLEEAILTGGDMALMVSQAEDFLRTHLPDCDPNVAIVNHIIDGIIADRNVTKVNDMLHRIAVHRLSKRSIQRLFSQYVGVSPKWVIQRTRLHEAAEQLATGNAVNWTQLAFDLGYFDQAHFIKDFKALVGKTPAEYARQCASNDLALEPSF